jgi:hypothetical protein
MPTQAIPHEWIDFLKQVKESSHPKIDQIVFEHPPSISSPPYYSPHGSLHPNYGQYALNQSVRGNKELIDMQEKAWLWLGLLLKNPGHPLNGRQSPTIPMLEDFLKEIEILKCRAWERQRTSSMSDFPLPLTCLTCPRNRGAFSIDDIIYSTG